MEIPVAQRGGEEEVWIERYTEGALAEKAVVICLLVRGVGSTSAGAAAPLKFTLAGMVPAYLRGEKKILRENT